MAVSLGCRSAGARSLESGGQEVMSQTEAFAGRWDRPLPGCLRPLTSARTSHHPKLISCSPRIGLSPPLGSQLSPVRAASGEGPQGPPSALHLPLDQPCLLPLTLRTHPPAPSL